MIEPPLYKTIAVASTFSPRFIHVLSEAKRIRDRFGSELTAIYVGEWDWPEAEREFNWIRGVRHIIAVLGEAGAEPQQGADCGAHLYDVA